MKSPSQIRAARALLGIGADELSAASGVAASTISRIEAGDVSEADGGALLALAECLAGRGVTFLADGDAPCGGEGVRLTSRSAEPGDDGLRPEMLNASNDG